MYVYVYMKLEWTCRLGGVALLQKWAGGDVSQIVGTSEMFHGS